MSVRFDGVTVMDDGEMEPLVRGDVVFRAYAVGRNEVPRTLGNVLRLFESPREAVEAGSLYGSFVGYPCEVTIIVRPARGSAGWGAGQAVDRPDDPQAVAAPHAGPHDGLAGLGPREPVGGDR